MDHTGQKWFQNMVKTKKELARGGKRVELHADRRTITNANSPPSTFSSSFIEKERSPVSLTSASVHGIDMHCGFLRNEKGRVKGNSPLNHWSTSVFWLRIGTAVFSLSAAAAQLNSLWQNKSITSRTACRKPSDTQAVRVRRMAHSIACQRTYKQIRASTSVGPSRVLLKVCDCQPTPASQIPPSCLIVSFTSQPRLMGKNCCSHSRMNGFLDGRGDQTFPDTQAFIPCSFWPQQ